MASHSRQVQADQHAVLLFDGVCNLCNGAVNFIIDRDPEGYFKFAPLQSDVAEEMLGAFGLSNASLDSMVLVEGNRCYRRSTAVLMTARRLGPPWALVYAFIVVPRPVRDAIYDWIAENRYHWFGKREACRVPTPDLQARFL